jgi:hypothetical protein
MTEQTFDYKALRFLNDRVELYNITDNSMRIALYDFPENEYVQGMVMLRQVGYVNNKDLREQGLSITSQGQIRLNQLQRIVENEKIQDAPVKIKFPLGLGQELFWPLLIAIIGGAFALGHYFGSNKFDRNLIELSEVNRDLRDSIKSRDYAIKYIRNNSDSAHNILGHMPYNEMTLDTASFRKVQTTIENAGAALNLNK